MHLFLEACQKRSLCLEPLKHRAQFMIRLCKVYFERLFGKQEVGSEADTVANDLFYFVRWYDTVPLSRIISRCTTDIAAIDDTLPNWMESLLQKLIMLMIALAVVVYVSGWRAVLMGSAIAFVGVGFSRVYLKAQLCVKRENSNAKSPGIVLSCFCCGRY